MDLLGALWRFTDLHVSDNAYRDAFARIRAEYREMPGMRLTAAQAQWLCDAELSICLLALSEMVEANFLSRTEDGSYAKVKSATAVSSGPMINSTPMIKSTL